MRPKFEIQSHQYHFPYHYLVDFELKEFATGLRWGLDYYNYITTVTGLVQKYITNDILDIGCGDGALLHHLAAHKKVGDHVRAVGIDLDEKHSLIVSVETLEHVPDEIIPEFTSHFDRLLEPGGVIIISVPAATRPLSKKHYRHYTGKMVRDTFPTYTVEEEFYVTHTNSFFFGLVQTLLTNKKCNLNFGIFRRVLLKINDMYFKHVKESQGGHVVMALRKP